MFEISDNPNHSGFDDDTYSSQEEDKMRKNKNNFYIKSNFNESLNTIINKKSNSNSNIDIKRSISSNTNNSNNNESIIEMDVDKNEKVSINSEEEKKNEENDDNNIKQDNNDNDLNTNLLLKPSVEDNSLIFNLKQKLSKTSTTDDMFRETIKIPANYKKRSNRFNTSRLARTFMYEEKEGNKKYLLKSKKFGIAKSGNIITYILNLYIFSEFCNFNNLEKDTRFNLFFIPLIDNKFNPNVEKVLASLNLNKNNSEQFMQFIKGMNNLLIDKEYKDIQKKNSKYKACLIILIIFLLLLIGGMSYSFYYFMDLIFQMEEKIKYAIIISAGVVCLIFIIILIFQIIRLCRVGLYKKYNNLNYMLMNYSRYNDYIEEWNKNYFEMHKIRATIPISLNYIMFNLEPYQDIEINHLNMKWFIEKIYKGKTLANDKEFIKYFIKVRSTLVEGNNFSYQ
jgi:hypothetical protein